MNCASEKPAELVGNDLPRVVIVTENCSPRWGGEAVIPMHYFRVLRSRGVDAYLVCHARTRHDAEKAFPNDLQRLTFIADGPIHRLLDRLGRRLPNRINRATFGFISLMYTQRLQRRVVRRLVREKGVNVVHQPVPVSPAQPSMIAGVGAPVVIGPLNGGMDYPPSFRERENAAERLAARTGRAMSGLLNWLIPGKRRARMVLVSNPRARDALPRWVSGEVIEVPENGVDLRAWHPLPDDHHAADGEPVRFAYVGRLVDWKAVDLLLEAWKVVRRSVDARLEIIGDGPERQSLESACARLGLTESVCFAGWLNQPELRRQLGRCDALVLPALLECGGAAVLEAMAIGLPVIATNWGGPADYIDRTCGILVDPESREGFVQGLAEAMTRLARSPELRSRMGEAGRRKVQDQFDWAVRVNRMMELYQQATRPATELGNVQRGGRLTRRERAAVTGALNDYPEPASIGRGGP